MYVNNSGPLGYKHGDYLVLGENYFLRYEGLHYDFEKSLLAFSGLREPENPFNPYQRYSNKSNWIAVVLVLVVPAIISAFFFWLSKRNERIKNDLARYETLFGKEEKSASEF
jgi:hypothetical protein